MQVILMVILENTMMLKICRCASQKASIPTAASELQSLLAVPALAGVPLLVVCSVRRVVSYSPHLSSLSFLH